ncbi:MAG: hypothetical protein AAFR23_10895, partial [Pseudomonadota bacterium]
MNWRFGFYLGTTELDGFIYGSASAAADVMKALIPFLIVAAWRNKMWSQMAASAVVWLVVTAYSLTSALGHAALNRQDTAGQRVAQATTYTNLQSDLERAKQQLSWVPQHRPAATVQSELTGKQAHKAWGWSRGCTRVKGRYQRNFCGEVTSLKAELGSAQQAAKLEQRIADTQAKLASMDGAGPKAADPQAQILAKLTGFVMPGISVEDVQTGLAVFIALLLEVGSGLGMYIAFAQWRIGDRREPSAAALPATDMSQVPAVTADAPAAPAKVEDEVPVVVAPVQNGSEEVPLATVANDNVDTVPAGSVKVMAKATIEDDVLKSDVVEGSAAETVKIEEAVHENDVNTSDDYDDDLSDLQKFYHEHTEFCAGANLNAAFARTRYNKAARKSGWRVLDQDEFNREAR